MVSKDIEEINNKLCQLNREFFEKRISPWMTNMAEKRLEHLEYGFSEPFIVGVNEYKNNKPLLMVVGQETGPWGIIKNNKFEYFEKSQDYNIKFTYKNLNQNEIVEWYDYNNKIVTLLPNKGCFWNFVRKLSDDFNFNICYNNLDKIHYIKNINDKSCVKLSYDDEKYLNEFQILKEEINIIKPDIVIATIGNSYITSLETALGVVNIQKLNKSNIVIDVSDIIKLGCRFLITYHPRYLRSLQCEDVQTKLKELIGKWY